MDADNGTLTGKLHWWIYGNTVIIYALNVAHCASDENITPPHWTTMIHIMYNWRIRKISDNSLIKLRNNLKKTDYIQCLRSSACGKRSQCLLSFVFVHSCKIVNLGLVRSVFVLWNFVQGYVRDESRFERQSGHRLALQTRTDFQRTLPSQLTSVNSGLGWLSWLIVLGQPVFLLHILLHSFISNH